VAGRFVIALWNNGGHVPPAVALGHRLADRGHDVRLLGPPSLGKRVHGARIRFRPYLRAPDPAPRPGVSLVDDLDRVVERLCGLPLAEEVLAELEQEATDVLVCDGALAAAVCAGERAGARTAALVPILYRPWARTWGRLMLRVNPTRVRLGLDELPVESPVELLRRVELVLVLTPRELDFPGEVAEPNVRYVGPVLEPEPETAWTSPWPEGDERPLVVVSFSSSYQRQERRLRLVLDALRGVRARVLVLLGDGIDPTDVEPGPGVEARRWVPHTAVFPHASLCITHGGLGTVVGALAHGVPLVCLPGIFEQGANARRVQALGAGRMLGPGATAEEARSVIENVLSGGSFREAADRLRRTILDCGSGERAVHELEALLSGDQ
jgi:MGT family glycosyltransferase